MRGAIICLLIAVVGSLTWLTWLRGPVAASSAGDSVAVLSVDALRVRCETGFVLSRSYTGQIRPQRSAQLSFETGGKVVAVLAREGQLVAAGDSLAVLDTRPLEASIRRLQASRDVAQARLEQMLAGPRPQVVAAARADTAALAAQLELSSLRLGLHAQLFADHRIGALELAEVTAEAKSLRARLDGSQQRLLELEAGTRHEEIVAQRALLAELDADLTILAIDLEKSVLRAPFGGRISARLVELGEVVADGGAAFRLIQLAAPELRVGLPLGAARRLEEDATYPVKIGEQVIAARLRSILPELEASTRSAVVMSLDSLRIGPLAVGQIGRLDIAERHDSAGFWLPATALKTSARGVWTCYGLVPEPHSDLFEVVLHQVETLHSAGDRIYLRAQLQDGDLIIRSGIHRISPGQRVRLQP